MAGFKNGKIMLPIKEFLIVKGQVTYELNTIDMTKVTVFYRKYNQEAFLETYSEMPKGDYRINEVGGNKQLEITNLDILDKYYSIQLCRVVDLTSSPYNPSGQVDPITLNQHLNEVIADVTFLFTYLKDVGMVMDSASGNKIMAELKPYTTWYMDKDGNMAAMPVDSLFEKFNDLVQELRQEVLKLLEQDLEVAERELLEEVKRQLDEYVGTDLKQRLDDYTTQLEERLQTMIDQAVADKGLMPEGSDWFEIGLGNWLVVDLFNKNYIHYPPQLKSSDNAGVVKKDITDGSKSQVIRFYTTTGKMLFIVRVNGVWSEWQELGEQTDTMQFTQANHGFVFTAVTLDGATRKWVKANKYTSADGIAIKIDNDRFDVLTRGVVNIPTSARDDKGEPFVYDEYYFLSQEVDGGFSRTKNEIGTFQYLAHISEIDGKQVAYIDIGDSYDLDYEVVDTETADRVGIGTYKTTLRTADTIEDLKRLNLKAGDVVEVLGYYTKGDGTNHKRKIENSDDGSGVQLSNGLYANIVHNGEVNVSWFGAKGDGVTDDTQAIQKALNYINIIRGDVNKFYLVSSELETKKYNTQIYDLAISVNHLGKGLIVGNRFKCRNLTIKRMAYYQNDGFSSVPKDEYVECEAQVYFKESGGYCKLERVSLGLCCVGIDATKGLLASYIDDVIGVATKTFIHIDKGVDANNITRIHSNPNIVGLTGSSAPNLMERLITNATFIKLGRMDWGNISNCLCYGYNKAYELTAGLEITGSANHIFIDQCHVDAGRFFVHPQNNHGWSVSHCYGTPSKYNGIITIATPFFYSRGDGDCIINNFSSERIDGYLIDTNQPTTMSDVIIYYHSTTNKGLFSAIPAPANTAMGVIKTSANINISNSKFEYENGLTGKRIIDVNGDNVSIYISNSRIGNYNVLVQPLGDFKYELNVDGVRFYKSEDIYDVFNPKGILTSQHSKFAYTESDFNNLIFRLAEKNKLITLNNEIISTLNTPAMQYAMELEGVKQDYLEYSLEKFKYDKQLKEEQKAKYKAYQQALKNNPNLTYKEFITSYSMMLPNIKEPTIPQSVQEFMKKYL